MIATAPLRWAACVSLAAALGYLLFVPLALQRLNPLTGDEPFYVVTAISMVRDRNLDETANYARRDYDEFYPPQPLPADWQGWPAFPRTLPPHPAVSDRDGLYTKHGLGLSAMIALPYEILGRVGAMLTIVLCAAFLAGQMFLLSVEAGARYGVSSAIALILALSLPIAPYSALIFPEIPAALLLIYAIRRFSASQNAWWQWLLAGCAVGFLPWLHQRFAPTAAVLALVVLARAAWTRAIDPLLPLLPVGAIGIGLVAYNYWLYGGPVQNAADHAGFSDITGTVNGGFGLLLDAQWGLLIAAPIYLLAAMCLPSWIRANRETAAVALLAIVPYIVIVASYQVWWGEWGPPARYLVPVAPLAAGPIAAWLSHSGRVARAAATIAALPGVVLTLIALSDLQRLYHHPDGSNNLYVRLSEILHIDLAGKLVAFQPFARAPLNERLAIGMLTVATWLAGMIIIYILPGLFRRRSSEPSGRYESTSP
jgi:hypothetical protein